ncbi:hypothetical protein KCU89_g7104, partial [Aureobasidium melanogenum]
EVICDAIEMATLPNEIILEIVKHFPVITEFKHPDDVLEEYNLTKNTLASLCLVSKTWRDIAQPLLYRTYIKTEKTDPDIDHDEYNEAKIEALEAKGVDISTLPEEEFEWTDYRKPIPIEMFIRTMIERPDLAEQVECLSISNYWDENAERKWGRTDVNKTLGEMMYNASLKVPLQKTKPAWRFDDWQEDWRNELREGDEIAEVALLMVLLPNVRCLDLGTSSGTYGTYVHDLWSQLLGPQSTKKVEHYGQDLDIDVDFASQSSEPPLILSRLEYFNARVDSFLWKSAPKIHIVSPILTIPSLKIFYGWGLQEEYWSENVRLPLAHLKEVFLNDCRVSEDVLIVILGCCKRLESLDVVYSRWTDEVNLSISFLMALSQRKETLKRLTLFLPEFYEHRNDRELFINAPWDLRDLTNLETLSLDYEIIFSEDADVDPYDPDNVKFPYNLPESIEQLNIENCKLNEDMAECACYLLDARKKFNKLKFFEVNYETLEPANDTQKDQIVKLSMVAGMFKVEGIRMSVVDDDDKMLVPPEMVKVEDGPGSDGEDDWSDMSGSELGSLEDSGDRSNEDDRVNEDTNEETQGRYNLRPR